MTNTLETLWYFIWVLVEIAVILLVIDWIMTILGGMIGFSWKKFLASAFTVFGFLWLKDHIKSKNKVEEMEEHEYEK